MREIHVHCSAHDRTVRFALTDAPRTEGRAPIADVQAICLEIDERCAGGTCPVTREPSCIPDARRARSGLAPLAYRHVWTPCDACGHTTEQALSEGGYITCGVCGTTRDWHPVGGRR